MHMVNLKSKQIDSNPAKDMEIKEKILDRVHSRVYEILGYVSLIHSENLNEKTFESIVRIEKVCKALLNELKEVVNES
jgi:hypothetical protein